MEFEVVREKFAKALSNVNRAISVKASLPVLQNVLIEEEDGRLKITATDLDKSIITWVGAKIEGKPKKVTIPAKALLGFVSGLSSNTIKGEVKGDSLKIKAGKAQAQFNGINAGDYPNLDYKIGENHFEFKTDLLKRSIDETYFAASVDETKPLWSGILFKVTGETLHIVGLDGFRMSKKEVLVKDLSKKFKANFEQVVIPAKNLLEVIRLASGVETIKVDVQEDKSVVVFELEDLLFVSKILDGDYPDYNAVIPSDSVISFKVLYSDLLSSLKLASVFANDNNAVKISIDPENNKMVITSDDVELGKNKLEVPISDAEGEKIDVGFNAKYLLDYLNNVSSETIVVRCSGQTTPATFIPFGREDYLHLAVPLQPFWE